ncbi:acyltransferase family protein [Phosphitispora sp. TUW77]|uniref:acyltransferase family protein n=1 Tax=Phosphitispora sp. TUW77 TaxID=3152361 RepID=UPI003AB4C849
MQNSDRGYITGIDGLRAVAALLVMLFHYYVFAGSPKFTGSFIANAGSIGVDIFFTISGFVLFLPFASLYQRREPILIKDYFSRRFRRILPLYYFNLFIIVTLFTPAFIMQWDKLKLVLISLVFGQNFVLDKSIRTINGVTWTLGLEMLFYILLPFIYKLFVGKRWIYGLTGALLISYIYKASALYLFNPGWDDSYYIQFWVSRQLPGVIQQFALGMAAASLWINYRDKNIFSNKYLFSMLGLLGFGMLVLGMWFFIKYGSAKYWFGSGVYGYIPLLNFNTFLSLAAAMVLLSLCNKGTITSKALSWKPLGFLGTISYGIYLWHNPIGKVFNNAIGLHQDKLFLLLLIAGTTTIAISTLSYCFIEKPFIKRQIYQFNKVKTVNKATNY